MIVHSRKRLNHKVKKELIYYEEEFDSLNFLIKIVIEFNNSFYKLVLEISYNNPDNKTKIY